MAVCKNRIDIITNYSNDDWRQQEERQIEEWAIKFQDANAGDIVGETIRFHVADGYAVYMVQKQKPLTLVHVNQGDGYQIPAAHIRGLNLTEVRKMVDGERMMRELFRKKKAS